MLDVWSYITELIEDDKDKCRLMMTCKWISECQFHFNQINIYEKILRRSRWFDHFTNVLVEKKIEQFPFHMNKRVWLLFF